MIERNFKEEMINFDNSQTHYFNLLRLFFEGRATYNLNQMKYAMNYLDIIRESEKFKIESMTRYFVENFDHMKKKITEGLSKKCI